MVPCAIFHDAGPESDVRRARTVRRCDARPGGTAGDPGRAGSRTRLLDPGGGPGGTVFRGWQAWAPRRGPDRQRHAGVAADGPGAGGAAAVRSAAVAWSGARRAPRQRVESGAVRRGRRDGGGQHARGAGRCRPRRALEWGGADGGAGPRRGLVHGVGGGGGHPHQRLGGSRQPVGRRGHPGRGGLVDVAGLVGGRRPRRAGGGSGGPRLGPWPGRRGDPAGDGGRRRKRPSSPSCSSR